MSTGFSGSTTRSLGGLTKEVESRLKTKKLDVFTDDFSPPGTAESFKGSDFDKPNNGYQKPHDDTSSKDSTSSLAAAGNAKDQPKLDEIDRVANMFEVGIKPEKDQFPGAKLKKEPASDNAAFDVHATDPARLKSSDGPETIEKEMNRRLSKLEHTEELKITYKGFVIIAFSKGGGNWVAQVANRMDFTGTKAEAINKAKQWVDENRSKLK